MTTFLVFPDSWDKQRRDGVRYFKASRVEKGIGHFEEHPDCCKTVNGFYEVGNVRIEKCTYDPKGNKT